MGSHKRGLPEGSSWLRVRACADVLAEVDAGTGVTHACSGETYSSAFSAGERNANAAGERWSVPVRYPWLYDPPALSAADDLRMRDFPALVAGKCVLVPERLGRLRMLPGRAVRPDQYALSHNGALSHRWMSFVAVEDEAMINLILKRGRLGDRFPHVPPAALVDALRELGFKTMVLPSGKWYEILGKGRGIRRLN